MAIVIHTINGSQYAYNHHRVGNKVVCDYIGKAGGSEGGGDSAPVHVVEEVTQQMDEKAFMKYHNTGYIDTSEYKENTVKDFEDDSIKTNSLLLKTIDTSKGKIEFRQDPTILKFAKPDPETGYAMRNEKDEIIYMTPEELKASGTKNTETTIIAFNDKGQAVGFASNEMGADGVFVATEYQRIGIGTQLLAEFRKQFKPDRKIGQMTPAGEKLTLSYLRYLNQKNKQ